MFRRLRRTCFFRYIQLLIKQVELNDVSGNAVQLAYYMLFSIFPLLLVGFSLLAYLNLDKDAIFKMIAEFAPKQILTYIQNNLEQLLSNRRGGLLSIGILATLWSASNGMTAAMKALNQAYGISDRRSFIYRKLLAISFTLLMIMTVSLTLVLIVFGQQIGGFLLHKLHMPSEIIAIWNVVRKLLSVVVILVVFIFLYWVAPNRKGTLTTVLPGALFASLGWCIVSAAFAFYINHFANYAATYGSIGIVIILMLWFYLTGIILIIGGEINGTNALIHRKKATEEFN